MSKFVHMLHSRCHIVEFVKILYMKKRGDRLCSKTDRGVTWYLQ